MQKSWLLLPPIMGFPPRDDEYITATVFSSIADELTRDGPVLRYPVEGTDTVSPFWVPNWWRSLYALTSAGWVGSS